MLLRRMTENLKSQNWVAVALDFLIVVLGVFLGLQVSNWNNARLAAADERIVLERLQEESERVVAYWRYELDMSERANANRRILLQVLARGAMTDQQKSSIDDALMRIGHYGAFNPPRAVLDELFASGGLSRISDITARTAVSDYDAELDFIQGQLDYFRLGLPEIVEAFDGSIFSVYDPFAASLRDYEYDLSILSKDRQFMSDMVDFVRDQLQFEVYRQNMLETAERMCGAISAAIAKTCDPPIIGADEIMRREGVNQSN